MAEQTCVKAVPRSRRRTSNGQRLNRSCIRCCGNRRRRHMCPRYCDSGRVGRTISEPAGRAVAVDAAVGIDLAVAAYQASIRQIAVRGLAARSRSWVTLARASPADALPRLGRGRHPVWAILEGRALQTEQLVYKPSAPFTARLMFELSLD